MDMTELLRQVGGVQSVARDLGIDETQATTGLEALLPAVLGGFKKQAWAQPTGLEGLAGMLGGLGGGGLLDEVLAPRPTDVNRGNDVLGQIFGTPDVSRTVARNAASQTGLDPALLKKMLPIVAMLVAGVLSKQGTAAQAPSGGAGAPDLGSLFDLNRDGNPLDDILGMAGKFLR